ncbi:MAG: NUDIX domain-containing protein [Gammaproteobacteria bacterium]|nr:NUDIX domain-containing protein [Gammaproteobacteria bacterium]
MKKHRILDKRIVYDGYFSMEKYRLEHTLFEGGWGTPIEREVFERGSAAAVLPYDPSTDRVLLIEQFRIGAIKSYQPPWMLEVIAGVLEPGEQAADLVRREAAEEAGCELQALRPIGEFLVSPGSATEHIELFCGRADLTGAGGVHGLVEEGENILVHTFSAAEAVALCERGEIRNAIAIIALQWLAIQRLRGETIF